MSDIPVPDSNLNTSKTTLPKERTNVVIDSNSSSIEVTLEEYFFSKSVFFYCAIAAFGGFSMGYDSGTISGIVNMKNFIESFGDNQSTGGKLLSDTKTGLILSLFNIGCIFGSLVLAKLGDTHGRRIGIIVSSIIYICGCTIQVTSVSKWYQFMIGRIVAGSAVGACTVLCPMIIAESSPKQIKGTTIFGFQLNCVIGVFIGSCITYQTKTYKNNNQWRIPVACGIAWGTLLIIGMIFMPESPQYLINNNQIEKARASIAKCYNTSPENPHISNEIRALQEELAIIKASGPSSWKDIIFGNPKIFLRVIVGMMLQALNQLSGINYFFYFGVKIFKQVGIDSYITTIILSVTNIVGTLIGVYIVERVGRRVCLLTGATCMAVCFLIYTCIGSFGFYVQGHLGPTNATGGYGLIFITNLFIFSYAATFGGCIYTVIAVLYPLNIRTKAISLTSIQLFLWAFIIGMLTPTISSKIHFFYGFVFFGCLLFSIAFIYLFVPETKGLGFEDVDEMYAANIPAWKSSSWNPSPKAYLEDIIVINTESKC